MAKGPFTPSELTSQDVVWLLDVEWDGYHYRFATDAVSIDDEDGIAIPYEGGLDVDVEVALALFSVSEDRPSPSFSLVFPVDVGAMIARGHDLSTATGELAMWTAGRTYEQRQVVLVGRVVEPNYAGDGEPVAFTLKEDPADDTAVFPPLVAQVNPTTWPYYDPAVFGRYYPWVLGTPGVWRSTVSSIYVPANAGFSIAITGGTNAHAGVTVLLYSSDPGDYSMDAIQAEMEAQINVAIGGGTVTVTYLGGAFVIDTIDGNTVTIAAPGGGAFDLTSALFGGVVDQDSVARTWTGEVLGGKTTGSPILPVQLRGTTRYAIVSDGRVAATSVRVINVTQTKAATLNVTQTTDGLDRTVSVVDLALAPAGFFEPGDELWARWDFGGGLISPWGLASEGDGTTPATLACVEGAGDVMRYLLEHAPLIRADVGRIAAAASYLNRYKLAFYVDEPTAVWDFLVDRVFPILPISVISSSDGFAPVVWRADATASDATLTLTEGQNAHRNGPVQYEDGTGLVNDVEVRYAPRGDVSGEYRGRIRLTNTAINRPLPSDEKISAPSTINQLQTSLYTRMSGSRYGAAKTKVIEAAAVFDSATAELIAHDAARRGAFRWRTVPYTTSWPELGQQVQVGDVATITDEAVSLSSTVALVRSVRDAMPDVELELVIIEDPARDSRA